MCNLSCTIRFTRKLGFPQINPSIRWHNKMHQMRENFRQCTWFVYHILVLVSVYFYHFHSLFIHLGLMAHNVVHSKKKFKCQLCDVWFKTSGNMKEHMKVHKGLVFKCSHCGKDFNKIGNLRLHEMRHTKSLKQFQCDLCPRLHYLPSYA